MPMTAYVQSTLDTACTDSETEGYKKAVNGPQICTCAEVNVDVCHK